MIVDPQRHRFASSSSLLSQESVPGQQPGEPDEALAMLLPASLLVLPRSPPIYLCARQTSYSAIHVGFALISRFIVSLHCFAMQLGLKLPQTRLSPPKSSPALHSHSSSPAAPPEYPRAAQRHHPTYPPSTTLCSLLQRQHMPLPWYNPRAPAQQAMPGLGAMADEVLM